MTLSNFLAILLIIKMLRPVSNKERFLVEVNALNKDIVWYLRNMDQRLTSTQKRLRQYFYGASAAVSHSGTVERNVSLLFGHYRKSQQDASVNRFNTVGTVR